MQEDFLYGVNEILLKIIQKVLEDYKICNLISKTNYSINKLNDIKYLFDKIIVIGDTAIYQIIRSDEKVKFYPYNNIALYCDSDELNKLQEAIYIYANEYEYEIEIYYEDNIQDVIEMINYDKMKDIAILLTNNPQSKEIFEKEIKEKAVFVNENPFKQEINSICNYLK